MVLSLCVQSLSYVRLLATPWTVDSQAPLSMGFPRREYWSGLPFPSPGDLPNPQIELESLASPFFFFFFFCISGIGRQILNYHCAIWEDPSSFDSTHLLFTLWAQLGFGLEALLPCFSSVTHPGVVWLLQDLDWFLLRLQGWMSSGPLTLTLQPASPQMSLWWCQRIRRSHPNALGSFRPLLTSHLLTPHWPKPVLRSVSRCTTELHGNRRGCKERQRAGTRWRVLLQTTASQHTLHTAPHKISLSPTQWSDICIRASQMVLLVKNLPANEGDIRDMGSIPGLGMGEGHGNLLQYSCLENLMDWGA